MTLLEVMSGLNPNPNYKGMVTADDMIFAIDFDATGDPDTFLVAQVRVSEASGSLSAQTASSHYLRSGEVTTKTGTSKEFSVSGDLQIGDAFQDALLDFGILYGVGQEVIRDYVYFNMLSGKGERGTVSIQVSDHFSGAAGDNAAWSATFTTQSKPDEYTYV